MSEIKNVDSWFDENFGSTYTADTEIEEPVDAEWEKIPNPVVDIKGIWESAKYAVLFGGLTVLIYFWQYAGLMDASVAVPSMLVCTALAGWGVGKNGGH